MNEKLIRELAVFNQQRFLPGTLVEQHPFEIEYIEELRKTAKKSWGRDRIDPTMECYEDLLERGPGQGDILFPWLANHATLSEMGWFLRQEASGEAGFGDLVAMTLVKMPDVVKLEMSRNFWDEVGRGEERGMHHRLLADVLTHLDLSPSVEGTVAESLQLSNLMAGLAAHRRYAFLSVGALGVIEMTAPGRVSLVDAGLERLGVPLEARRYFALHATLDIRHSRDWNREVVGNLREHLAEIVEGAYLRLWCGAECFSRYRREMWSRAPEYAI